MRPRLHYDADIDAAYLRFSAGEIVSSAEVALGVVIDYDAEGRIVALEFRPASDRLPQDALAAE